jgi:hypothetical protein
VVLLRYNSNPAHSQRSPTGGIRTMLWVALASKRVEATHSIVKTRSRKRADEPLHSNQNLPNFDAFNHQHYEQVIC